MLMLACWPVAKSCTANCLILQKENVFHMTFGLAVGWLTCTFNSIKVPLSNIYLIYMYIYLCIILCTIILPFNRTMITVKIVSKVISDIIGSCCRLISQIHQTAHDFDLLGVPNTYDTFAFYREAMLLFLPSIHGKFIKIWLDQ